MANNPERKRGKRIRGSGRTAAMMRDIHSKVRNVAVHHEGKSNFTAVVTDNAIYYDCAVGDEGNILNETVETHLVPRKSLTERLMLGAFSQKVELAAIPTRQLVIGGNMVATEEHRVTWKSDRSLLNRKPMDDIGKVAFKREGSISQGAHTRKFTITQKEQPELVEKIIENVDDSGDFERDANAEARAEAERILNKF